MIRKLLFFLVVFILTVVWRFPYERAIADRVSNLENRTGVRIAYTPESASILGVEWGNVTVTTPNGMRIAFEQAKLRPNWSGLSAYLRQQEGQARVTLSRDGVLGIRMDRLMIATNTEQFGTIRATGDLSHDLRAHKGEGNLRLELPEFKAPFPIADLKIELGSKLFWQDRGQGYDLRCDVNLMSTDQKFHAEGNLAVEPQPGAPGRLSGNLRFNTPMRRGRLLITGGTWKDPNWEVRPENS